MESGEPVGYARNIRQAVPGITGIFTDNNLFKKHLVEDYGIDKSIIYVLRHPVLAPSCPVPPSLNSTRILWAGRLDRQKQPDILLEIAQLMPGLIFDVYGSAVMENGDAMINKLRAIPNIHYHGPFDNLDEVLVEEYCCFLYTSAWDGLPNILLEMIWAGMLVIAPKIGGIGLDLTSDHLILIKDPRNVSDYLNAISWIYANPRIAEKIRLKGQRFVRDNHLNSIFEDSLSASGYLA